MMAALQRVQVCFIVIVVMVIAGTSTNGELILDLSGQWQITNANGSISVKGQVPGSVHTALINASMLGDPYYRFNDLEYRWVAEDNWTYSYHFQATRDLIQKNNVQLVCVGLDTIADVTINGMHVGSSNNMFVRYVWDVKEMLKQGRNTIKVSFHSAISYAAQRFKRYPYDVPPDCPPDVQQGICHPNLIRKEQCSFSWDWGPAFAPMGIWKGIYLEGFDFPIIRDVVAVPYQSGMPSSWWLNITTHFDLGNIGPSQTTGGSINVLMPTLSYNKSFAVSVSLDATQISIQVSVPKARTWWPSGFGSQPRYPLVVLFKTSKSSETSSRDLVVGFRKVDLVQEKITNSTGLSFYFKINDRPIFTKGTNWIPADAFQERVTREKLRTLLQSVVDANMHALRVWGGGIYEQDAFYEICDELGIVLWQDFMFGCAMYPTDEEFVESVRDEVTLQVRRLNNHPSVIAWSANNENEVALRQNWYGTSKNFTLYKNDYIFLYIGAIREIVLSKATGVPFMSSSPSNGVQTQEQGWIAQNPQSNNYGDVHYYNYLADCWNATTFPKPRFASEYGFQSWPSFHTISKVSIATDWSYLSNFSNHRQHHTAGQQEMLATIQKRFNLPQSKDPLVYYRDLLHLTQISQALCIKFETEHYRRLQSTLVDGLGHCMGALYWQLNDIWQAPTWASIEYGERWKMLHYYSRDFFAPVLASAMTQEGVLYVYSITDTVDLSNASLITTVRSWQSLTPLYQTSNSFSQHASSSQLVVTTPLSALLQKAGCQSSNAPAEFSCFLTAEIRESDSAPLSPVNPFYLASFKDVIGLKKANITITSITKISSSNFAIALKSDAVAPFTWLDSGDIRGRFSQNGFLVTEPAVSVTFIAWQPTSAEELVKSLNVKSFMDMY